jgi:hypothetical protein
VTEQMQKVANFFAHIARILLHLIALVVIWRKLWPEDLMSKPLGKLTVGELLGGLFPIVIMFIFGGTVLRSLFHPLPPKERDPDWASVWMGAFAILAGLVGFVIFYNPGPKDGFIEIVHGFATAIVGWLLS